MCRHACSKVNENEWNSLGKDRPNRHNFAQVNLIYQKETVSRVYLVILLTDFPIKSTSNLHTFVLTC